MKIKKLTVNCWNEDCIFNEKQDVCAGECSLNHFCFKQRRMHVCKEKEEGETMILAAAIILAASWFSFIAAATCFKYSIKRIEKENPHFDINNLDCLDYLLFWGGLAFGLAAVGLSIAVVMA